MVLPVPGKFRRVPLVDAVMPHRIAAILAAGLLAGGIVAPPSAAQNQPAISPGGVVNAASFMPAGRPAGAIARGSIFSIFGTNLGPVEGMANQRIPLAKELGGVTVAVFDSGGNRFGAYPLFVGAGQINALMPSDIPAAQYFVQVEITGAQSNRVPVKVVHASFGLFGRPLSTANTVPPLAPGPRVAAAQNFVAENTFDLNAPETAARPGQAVVLWGTGLGPIAAPDSEAPPVVALDTAVEVLVGGKPAEIRYQGRSPCCPGVDQINLIIPLDAPLGCAVPVSVRVHGAIYSNIETISIGRDGRGCSDSRVFGSGRRARISLLRTMLRGEPMDQAIASFTQSGELVTYPPPPGSCIGSQVAPVIALGLDPGAQINLAGPQIGVSLKDGPPFYSATAPPGPLFLGPGAYKASATGGAGDNAVGPFEANLTVDAPFEWIAPGGGTALSRDGIALKWSGAAARTVLTAAIGIAASRGSGTFSCAAATGANELPIPAAILSNYPLRELAIQLGQIWAPPGSEFSATGLDGGDFDYSHTEVRTVILPPAELPSTPVKLPNGRLIQNELATTFEERAAGLMHRPELAPNRGILFVFDSPGIYPFWMYRTLAPLDIVWLDTARKIVFISANTPPCESENSSQCPNYFPSSVAKYVLEIPAGQAAANSLAVGSQLDW